MEELIAAIVELLFEFLSELFIEAVVALIARSVRSLFANRGAVNPVLAGAFYFFLGAASGGGSLFLLPHPIFHPSKFHGMSLLVSPVLTGLAMSLVGVIIRRKGKEPVRIESFGYGFAFALGMAVVRLVFVR
jgi:hypothetical protein